MGEKAKMIFIGAIVVAAFILVPNLGSDLMNSCKQAGSSFKSSANQTQGAFKDLPLAPVIRR